MRKSKTIQKSKQPLRHTSKSTVAQMPLRKWHKSSVASRNVSRKKPSIAKLKKEADKWFSLAVRYRFLDENGLVQCITCSVRKPLKQMQNGHFMSRQFNATRFSEDNCAPQCVGCNVMQHGRQYEFSLWLEEFYGSGTAQRLREESRTVKQFTAADLQQIIADSKEIVKFYEKKLS